MELREGCQVSYMYNFDYLHMNKITTIVRNIERQNAGENMISKEGKVNSVTAEYLGVKITIKIW